MYNIVSKLLIYGDMEEESILMQLSDIFRCMDDGSQTKDVLRTRVFKQVKRILEVQQITHLIRICGTTI